jgi:hypothetical protein
MNLTYPAKKTGKKNAAPQLAGAQIILKATCVQHLS